MSSRSTRRDQFDPQAPPVATPSASVLRLDALPIARRPGRRDTTLLDHCHPARPDRSIRPSHSRRSTQRVPRRERSGFRRLRARWQPSVVLASEVGAHVQPSAQLLPQRHPVGSRERSRRATAQGFHLAETRRTPNPNRLLPISHSRASFRSGLVRGNSGPPHRPKFPHFAVSRADRPCPERPHPRCR